MATTSPPSTRVVTVTAANLRQNHLYLNGQVDFFPKESIGPASSRAGLGRELHLDVAGLEEPVFTDLPVDAKSGRPRGIFRRRSWVRQFFAVNGVQAGDSIVIERKDAFRYEIRPAGPKSRLKAAEFFAGIGLVRLGLERQGFEVVFANDIDPQKLEMYRANFGDADFALGDIHKIDPRAVPDADLYTASFPCNDLSIAGAMAGLNGRESGAFWGLIRILKAKRTERKLPRMVLLENVPGFLMSHGGRDLEAALLALNEIGYAVDVVVIDAVRFVPQSRARLFVIAQRGMRGSYPFGLSPSAVRTPALTEFILAHRDIRWAIRSLPTPPDHGPRLADIIEDLRADDPAWWSEDRVEYFMNQLSARHARAAAEMIAGGSVSYATAFRRVRNERSMAELRTDGIAGCLRTPRGGSGRQILFKAGRGKRQVRLLSARECARLQGVHDAYKITVPLNQALFGFGDAVCVPVVEWIAANYLRPVLEESAVRRVGPPALLPL